MVPRLRGCRGRSPGTGADDAAKTKMAGRGVDRLGEPGRGAVATTVIRRAEVGAALDHLPRDPDLGPPRIIAVQLGAAPRIARGAARLERFLGMRGVIP